MKETETHRDSQTKTEGDRETIEGQRETRQSQRLRDRRERVGRERDKQRPRHRETVRQTETEQYLIVIRDISIGVRNVKGYDVVEAAELGTGTPRQVGHLRWPRAVLGQTDIGQRVQVCDHNKRIQLLS